MVLIQMQIPQPFYLDQGLVVAIGSGGESFGTEELEENRKGRSKRRRSIDA
jgi:hypothetical protein